MKTKQNNKKVILNCKGNVFKINLH
jgi:hypothetical protein